jgi:hypothetical protein
LADFVAIAERISVILIIRDVIFRLISGGGASAKKRVSLGKLTFVYAASVARGRSELLVNACQALLSAANRRGMLCDAKS